MTRAADRFEGLSVFLTVARRRSFAAAAVELGVTKGAVSHAVRALEQRVGLPLFSRTTRNVGLTEAGARLLACVEPASDAIGEALVALDGLRERPSGVLRLTVPRMAASLLVEPVLARFGALYPEVAVEVDVDNAFVDLAEGGFDAGIRLGEHLAKDMVAVRLTRDVRWVVVGAPSYFAARGRPASPEDLLGHACIRYRLPSSGIYRWELVRDREDMTVEVPGPFTVNDGVLALALARAGLGLAYVNDLAAEADLAKGTLEIALERHAPTGPGFFLYFPARAQAQPKLRAFIDTAVAVLAPGRKPRRAGRER